MQVKSDTARKEEKAGRELVIADTFQEQIFPGEKMEEVGEGRIL